MLNAQKINDLIHSVFDSLPVGLKSLPKDFEKNLKSAMHAAFSKLDLVTREEFDTQTQVLLKTRKKIQELEHKVQALERELKGEAQDR